MHELEQQCSCGLMDTNPLRPGLKSIEKSLSPIKSKHGTGCSNSKSGYDIQTSTNFFF